MLDSQAYGTTHDVSAAARPPDRRSTIVARRAIWAVEGALLLGILTVSSSRGAGDARRSPKAARWRSPVPARVDEHRVGVRLRRRHRGAAGFRRRSPSAEGDSQSAGQRGDHRDDARRHHRFGVRRPEHRAGGDGGQFMAAAERRRTSRSRCCTAWRRWRAAAWTRCRTTARSSRCWPSPG